MILCSHLKQKMMNINNSIFFIFLLFISSCRTNEKKTGKSNDQLIEKKKIANRKSEIDFENDAMRTDSFLEKNTARNIRNTQNQKKGNSSKTSKVYESNLNVMVTKKNIYIVENDQELIRIPQKWSNTYSNDPKWMDLFDKTSDAFLSGWSNEFQNNPGSRITKEELLFAYRSRMEKIFFETPSFIEFSVSKLKLSEKLEIFISKFQANIE